MGNIPITSDGFSSQVATDLGTYLRRAWDMLRSIQFNKKASILRYVRTDEGKPEIGIAPTEVLVDGLSNLNVFTSNVSINIVKAGGGKVQLGDRLFIFWIPVFSTDKIFYKDEPSQDARIYEIISIPYFDPDFPIYQVIGRAV